MFYNLPNRIEKLSVKRAEAYLPIFECISNSIQSFPGSFGPTRKIEIHITRLPKVDQDSEELTSGIDEVAITDNGVGFDDKNYLSFTTLDSAYKAQLGCKGIGRLYWLKFFDSAEISSFYKKDGVLCQRHFLFTKGTGHDDEVKELPNILATSNQETGSTVVLHRSNLLFQKQTNESAEDFVEAVIKTFLLQLFSPSCPRISVTDGNETTVINDVFKAKYYVDALPNSSFSKNGSSFSCSNILVKAESGQKSSVVLCASGRVVESLELKDFLSIPASFSQKDCEVTYLCFISGPKLDSDVNDQRNEFSTVVFEKSKEKSDIAQDWNIGPDALTEIGKTLQPFLESAQKGKRDAIIRHINVEEPQYSYIIKNHPEVMDNISYSDVQDSEKLSQALRIATQKASRDAQATLNQIIKDDKPNIDEHVDKLVSLVSDGAKTDLASYVIKRETIIQLLIKYLSCRDSGGYSEESLLHSLFIPMKKDSSSIAYDEHNLWLIDEKLAYDYYVYSDEPFSRSVGGSADRPDGFLAKVVPMTRSIDGSASIPKLVIIEFKRPGRNDYTEMDNPIKQVIDYAAEIKSSNQIKRSNGECCTINSAATINAFIIADITPSLARIARDRNFKFSPDTGGFYFDHDAYSMHIEIIGYRAVADCAEDRNKAFVKRLQLDDGVFSIKNDE